jgi:hypothetical protein
VEYGLLFKFQEAPSMLWDHLEVLDDVRSSSLAGDGFMDGKTQICSASEARATIIGESGFDLESFLQRVLQVCVLLPPTSVALVSPLHWARIL